MTSIGRLRCAGITGDHAHMKAATWIIFALCVLVAPAIPARAQAEFSHEDYMRVRGHVEAMAFDPTMFFPGDSVSDRSMIRIRYTGDDYGWPVYSIAIATGCLQGEPRTDACGSRVTARMVRAPAPPGMTRIRERGSHLVSRLLERRATRPVEIRRRLTELGVEWMEADVRGCSGALTLLERSADLIWVPEEIRDPRVREEITLVLHADKVEVIFDQYARRSTYHGHHAENSPAEWADELAAVLEPCWRPAQAPPPWRR